METFNRLYLTTPGMAYNLSEATKLRPLACVERLLSTTDEERAAAAESFAASIMHESLTGLDWSVDPEEHRLAAEAALRNGQVIV